MITYVLKDDIALKNMNNILTMSGEVYVANTPSIRVLVKQASANNML